MCIEASRRHGICHNSSTHTIDMQKSEAIAVGCLSKQVSAEEKATLSRDGFLPPWSRHGIYESSKKGTTDMHKKELSALVCQSKCVAREETRVPSRVASVVCETTHASKRRSILVPESIIESIGFTNLPHRAMCNARSGLNKHEHQTSIGSGKTPLENPLHKSDECVPPPIHLFARLAFQ